MRVEKIGRVVRIYALCDYPSWEPRYIGKTVQRIGQRHKAHIRDARRGVTRPVGYWLRKKLERGERLAIKLLEWVEPGQDWQERERHWIAKYREGGRLLNLTDGGEGLHGHRFTPEHRAKIAQALRTGKSFQCETCQSEFWRKQRDIAKGHCRFCSRACYSASLRGVSRPFPALTTARGIAAAALARRSRTECKRGHPLSGANLFVTSQGSRGCKECRKIHKAAYRSKAHG